jgi:glycosyltransferase involved in cell wall biosynthesis
MSRVAFVDQTGQFGGAELSLLDVITRWRGGKRAILFDEGPFPDALRARGIDTVVAQLPQRLAAVRKQSTLATKLTTLGSLYRHQRRLRQSLDGCSIVYANTPKALVASALATRLTRRKLVYHLRDEISPAHFSTWNRRLLVTLSNRCAARVIANSQATAQAFIEAGGRRSLVTVVYNGFEFSPFEQATAQAERLCQQVRAELGVASERPVLAVFGRIAEWKGQRVAIEALPSLPEAELWLVGEALFAEDQRYRESLERRVAELGLTARVRFLGHRSEVLPIFQAADVVVHCSTSPEPFGRVIVEAMLSRRPVVASRAGGAAEIVTHERDGLLAEPGDPSELARQVSRLLSDRELAERMVDVAEESARERFGMDAVMARIEGVLQEIT